MAKAAWLLAAVLMATACGSADNSQGAADPPLPAGHRGLVFSTCCRVPVPFDATAVLPGNVVDTEIMRIERPGLTMKLEYARAGEPTGSVVEGQRSSITIDGVPAVLREFPADGGGQAMLLSVSLPPPIEGQPQGAALSIRAECAGPDDCAAARKVMQGLNWE